MQTWISVAVSILAIYVATNEGLWQLARRHGNQLHFPVGLFTRVVYLIALPGAVAVAVLDSDDWVTSGGLLAFAGLWIATWPRTIVLDDQGVKELIWGGLRRRVAAWPEVLHAIRMEVESEREVHLILQSGKVIKHTRLHIDRDRFIREVGKHVEVLGGPPRVL